MGTSKGKTPKGAVAKRATTVKEPSGVTKGNSKDGQKKAKKSQVRSVNDISVRGPIMGRHTSRGLIKRYGGDPSIFFPYIKQAFYDYTSRTGKVMFVSREAIQLVDGLVQSIMTRLSHGMKHFMPEKGSLTERVVIAALESISPSPTYSAYVMERVKFHRKYAEKKSGKKSPYDAYYGNKTKRVVSEEQSVSEDLCKTVDSLVEGDMEGEALEPYDLDEDSQTEDEEEEQNDEEGESSSSSDSEDEQQSSSSGSHGNVLDNNNEDDDE